MPDHRKPHRGTSQFYNSHTKSRIVRRRWRAERRAIKLAALFGGEG